MKTSKEEILEIHEKCVGLRVYCMTLGGWFGEIKSVKDENTFIIESPEKKLIEVDIFSIRGLDESIAPPIRNRD